MKARNKNPPGYLNLNPLTEPPLTFHTFPEAFHRKNHEEVHSTHKNCATFEAGKLCVFQTNRFWPAPKEFKQNASMGALIEEKKMIIHQWVVYMNL